MKKTMKLILIILLFIIFALPTMVNATNITKTEYADNKITVTGTAGNSEPVQIVLFDTDGNVKYLTTTTTDNTGKFEITFPEIAGLTKGDYTIKTGSYDGKNTTSANVEVVPTNNEEQNNNNTNLDTNTIVTDSTNPKTGDNIIAFVVIFAIAIIGIVAVVIRKKQISKNKSK